MADTSSDAAAEGSGKTFTMTGGEAVAEAPADDAGPLRRVSTIGSNIVETNVVIGTSEQASTQFIKKVSKMVNTAYGYNRLSPDEVRYRLAMGDSPTNRVLHLAWRGDELVGCCSSTRQTPWCPSGCGHWGLLVVAVEAQGTGVASALVAAAEARLTAMGLSQCQIEYEYTCGDPQSERLLAWYEGTLGFNGGHAPTNKPGRSEFRHCRKRLGQRPPARASTSPAPDNQQRVVRSAPSSLTSNCLAIVRRILRALVGL